MARRRLKELRKDDSGAIAAVYALSLFGLVAIAGVGWDYARLAAMDSELQGAADQAALAAATQLDGREGAMVRARSAATTYLGTSTSSWVNETRLANDGRGRAITQMSFRFYASYDSANDTFGAEITNDNDGEDANIVTVTVDGREAFYALTPVVGLIRSGNIAAQAVAGLESATCNVPPLMFCAPSGSNDFPDTGDVGKALKLHMKANQADVWAPGNFGFLDIAYANTPSGNPNTSLGWNSDFAGCAGEAVESRTGSRTPEIRALNTRFDRYDNSAPSCDTITGDFCPAQNVRRDWVRVESHNNTRAEDVAALQCNPSGGGDWQLIDSIDAAYRPAKQGLPPDNCFLSNTCASFGDGTWEAGSYMTANHPGASITDVPDLDANGSRSRYEVYEWEKLAASRTDPRLVGSKATVRQNDRYDVELYCSYSRPVIGTAVAPSAVQKDRRVMTVASVDCADLNGHAPVDIIRWVDLFLLAPADELQSDKSFVAEIVGPAKRPGGGSAFQFYGRNKPVLLR